MPPKIKTLIGPGGFAMYNAEVRAVFGEKSYDKLLKSLTVVTKQIVGPDLVARCYKIDKGILYLPRSCIPKLAPIITLANKFVDVPPIDVQLKVDLFEDQEIIVRRVMQELTPERAAAGTAAALLNQPAGTGKTFIAAGIIATLKQRTVFITMKRPLLAQAVKDLRSALTCRVAAWGEKDCILDGSNATDVIVMVINSAMTRPKDFYTKFGFVLFDEVHSMSSDSRRDIFRLACTKYTVGMSATTNERPDKFDIIYHRELAITGIIYGAKLTEEDEGEADIEGEWDINVKVIKYIGPKKYTQNLRHESTGNVFIPYMIEQAMADEQRLDLAMNELIRLYNWRGIDERTGQPHQHTIYVFCEQRDPLSKISEEIQRRGMIVAAPELDNVVTKFIGGIKDKEISDAVAHARVILTTYGYSGTGVSIPRASAILFLTPRKSGMKQIIPRICRRGGPICPREIVDIVDWSTRLRSQYYSRKQAYEYFKAKVVEVTHEAK